MSSVDPSSNASGFSIVEAFKKFADTFRKMGPAAKTATVVLTVLGGLPGFAFAYANYKWNEHKMKPLSSGGKLDAVAASLVPPKVELLPSFKELSLLTKDSEITNEQGFKLVARCESDFVTGAQQDVFWDLKVEQGVPVSEVVVHAAASLWCDACKKYPSEQDHDKACKAFWDSMNSLTGLALTPVEKEFIESNIHNPLSESRVRQTPLSVEEPVFAAAVPRSPGPIPVSAVTTAKPSVAESPEVTKLKQISQSNKFVWFYDGRNKLTAFLGNFFDKKGVTYNGIKYKCAEGAFQAAKYPGREEDFKDLDGDAAVKKTRDYEKKYGLPAGWHAGLKKNVMKGILKAKFDQNLDLKEKLMATGNTYLVEHRLNVGASDVVWSDGYNGTGQNLLGQVLMEIRAQYTGVRQPQKPSRQEAPQLYEHDPEQLKWNYYE